MTSDFERAITWIAAYEFTRLGGNIPSISDLRDSALVVLVADIFDEQVDDVAASVRDIMPNVVRSGAVLDQQLPLPTERKTSDFQRPMGVLRAEAQRNAEQE